MLDCNVCSVVSMRMPVICYLLYSFFYCCFKLINDDDDDDQYSVIRGTACRGQPTLLNVFTLMV